MESSATDATPASVTLQSEWCWLNLGSRDGPYKSSRGDDLILLRTFVKNQWVLLYVFIERLIVNYFIGGLLQSAT